MFKNNSNIEHFISAFYETYVMTTENLSNSFLYRDYAYRFECAASILMETVLYNYSCFENLE